MNEREVNCFAMYTKQKHEKKLDDDGDGSTVREVFVEIKNYYRGARNYKHI